MKKKTLELADECMECLDPAESYDLYFLPNSYPLI